MPKPAVQIGARIRTFRIAAGMTQDRLAERVGVGAGQVVSRWERGLQVPRLDTATGIADSLGVAVDALARDTGVEVNPAGDREQVVRLLPALTDDQVAAVLALVTTLVRPPSGK